MKFEVGNWYTVAVPYTLYDGFAVNNKRTYKKVLNPFCNKLVLVIDIDRTDPSYLQLKVLSGTRVGVIEYYVGSISEESIFQDKEAQLYVSG